MAGVRVNLLGETFGYLRVVAGPFIEDGCTWWMCACDCGNETKVRSNSLRAGDTKSCGCYARSQTSIRSKTHGMSKTAIYRTWRCMLSRCYYEKDRCYSIYGGRGITVCDRWRESFENFYADMGDKPSSKHSLDRIDSDGNYCPTNCRWATPTEQANNRRNSLRVCINGISKSLADWAEFYGTKLNTIDTRIARGWSYEEAVCGRPRKPRAHHTNLYFVDGAYLSAKEAAKKYGIAQSTVRERLNRGWTIEEALTTPIQEKSKPKGK
jgi:hypothetical protein